MTNSTLQFAVGVYQGYSNASGTLLPITTLNAVATLRNSAGQTAVLLDTPTIYGPSNFVAGTAPQYDGGAPNQIVSGFSTTPLFGDGFGPAGIDLNANTGAGTA